MSLKKDLFQNLNCNKSAKEKIEIWVKRVNKNFFLNEDLSEIEESCIFVRPNLKVSKELLDEFITPSQKLIKKN